ncbi:hypothetical protein [Streptomyces sp. NPDC006477]|uniref:hypothetical protein n=1 Tax=Streptomyces sp. NPDC006477 TaxID=3364747 RepID=UPI0036B1C49E
MSKGQELSPLEKLIYNQTSTYRTLLMLFPESPDWLLKKVSEFLENGGEIKIGWENSWRVRTVSEDEMKRYRAKCDVCPGLTDTFEFSEEGFEEMKKWVEEHQEATGHYVSIKVEENPEWRE